MSFPLQPLLRGHLVELHPLQPNDFARLYEVAKDPLIWEQHPASDRFQADVFLQFFQGALQSGGAFLVLDHASQQPIGSTRFAGFDEQKREIEIGWTFLARSHWGGAANAEMKALMLNHAFPFVNRVLFRIGADNLRSRRAVEKIGATLVGPSPDPDGNPHVLYALTRAQWEAGGGASSLR